MTPSLSGRIAVNPTGVLPNIFFASIPTASIFLLDPLSSLTTTTEGSSRTDKSFSHFLDISLGFSFELETQLIITCNRNYINKEQLTKIEVKIQEFQKMTMGFQNKL